MNFKKVTATTLSLLMVLTMGTGCSGSSPDVTSTPVPPTTSVSSSSSVDSNPQAPTSLLPTAPVEVTFWHSMKGDTADLLQSMADEYNNGPGAAKKIKVTPIFQGAYDEASTKLSAIIQAEDVKELPDIMQMSSKGIFEVKESEFLYPVQNFIDMDPEGINIASLNPNALHYASYNNQILGLPFSNSSIMLYYNKDMFKKAGLDPEAPPKTIEELAEYTKKLTIKNGDKIETFGLGTKLRFFLLGTWIPMQGSEKYIFNNMDGRMGTPTELAMIKDGTFDHLLTQWQKVLDTKGVDYNIASPNEGFQSGLYAMMTASTSSMASLITKIQNTGTFDIGVAELPRVDANSTKGTGIGGSAVYVFDSGDDNKRLGAWDFLKFLASPEQSAKWFMNTGYYAMNSDAYDLPEVQEYLNKYPLFNIVLAIAEHSSNYPNYLEPWIPSFTDIDTTIQNEIIQMSDGTQDKATTIANVEQKVNVMLKDYLEANK